ncbi:hypothetical protein HMPREF1570_3524 [Klebsiella oxytoca KA-2]|nr:hypothetical protein HMPREF1570_3524 [Klebsiella oxytoca KA-2]
MINPLRSAVLNYCTQGRVVMFLAGRLWHTSPVYSRSQTGTEP